MSSRFALEIRGVSKSFGNKRALNQVSLSIEHRQTHVLLGSSGSGKTTLLRIVLGLLRADEGELFLNGESRASQADRTWLHHIGYVPQEGGLFPHLTARQNVELVARTLKMPSRKIAARLEELRQLVSIESSLMNRYPKQLSGGQRQRVALMRAAFLDPSLLILDEPLGALDPIIRGQVQEELKSIFNSLGKSVLMVTHDIDEARFFGHQLSLMREGRIVQTGAFEDLLNHPASAFVTRFLQSQRNWEEDTP